MICPRLKFHAESIAYYAEWLERHANGAASLETAIRAYNYHAQCFLDAIDALDGYERFKRCEP